ncbi:MAG: lysophospholipase [Candidatus Obscuribacterales bacterium]|nr:lysophospholipase [Candidatus Obscuribacterales bacterium]
MFSSKYQPLTENAKGVLGSGRYLRRILMAWIIFILVAYVALSPLLARAIYYKLLFPSSPYPVGYYDKTKVAGVQAEDLSIRSTDGVVLHSWYFDVPNSKFVVLIHHGNGGNLSILQWYADLAIRAGASVLVYDYRGYGKSTGISSLKGICDDSEAAYEFLIREKGWKPQQLINFGFSLGTGIASRLSQRKACAGTILSAPYVSLRAVCANALPWLKFYPSFLWAENDLGCAEYVSSLNHPPILILHGEEDEVIPISNSKALIRIANSPTEFVDMPCGHGDLDRAHDLIQSKISHFVDKLKPVEAIEVKCLL